MDIETMRDLMLYCIALAQRTPPYIHGLKVGAVVLNRNGEIVGNGYKNFVDNTRYTRHAERNALDDAGARARGATLITTLLPCSPENYPTVFKSCAELIVERGIEEVVYGVMDTFGVVQPEQTLALFKANNVRVTEYSDLNETINQLPITPRYAALEALG